MKCLEFRELILPLQDSEHGNVLPSIRAQWEAHLHSCEACLEFFEQQLTTRTDDQFTRQVLQATSIPAAEVERLLQDLSLQIKSIEPPEYFLGSVLERTASMQKSRQQSWQRWQRWKKVLMPLLLRPRFAQELSFVATICWALIFGLPGESFITTQDFQLWVNQITETLTL